MTIYIAPYPKALRHFAIKVKSKVGKEVLGGGEGQKGGDGILPPSPQESLLTGYEDSTSSALNVIK